MRYKLLIVVLLIGFCGLAVSDSFAVTAENIDKGVRVSLEMLKNVDGGPKVMNEAAGMLVFPSVFKGAIGIGGEYGEGALVIKGVTEGYYSTAALSLGFQLGGQKKTVIIAFMDQQALQQFQKSAGWKIGADAAVTVIAVGAQGSIDSARTNKPIVAFVFDKKGLMYDLSLNGAKVTKLKR